MTGKPMEINDLTASYGKRRVLHGITFAVEPGEVFGLIGLNGAGKTTMIRSILDLNPCEGAINLFGTSHRSHEARARLAYLPERYQPSVHFSGWESLALTLAYYKKTVDREQARALSEGLALPAEALDRRVRSYSKGMAQKLGLLGTLLTDLPLLILDEPMSGLDPLARVKLKDRLLEYKGRGHSIFFSSHILADIEEICDRIGIIHDGHLIHVGTPAEFVGRSGKPTLERAFLAAIEAPPTAA